MPTMTPLETWLANGETYRDVRGQYSRGYWTIELLQRGRGDPRGELVGRGIGETFDEAAADACNDVMRRLGADEHQEAG